MQLRFPFSIRLSAVALAVLLFAAGCEERIVGVRNNYVGSPINRTGSTGTPITTDTPPPRAQSGGFLDNLGEMLFGWTRVFNEPPAEDPLRGSAYRVRDSKDVKELMSRPSVKSSE